MTKNFGASHLLVLARHPVDLDTLSEFFLAGLGPGQALATSSAVLSSPCPASRVAAPLLPYRLLAPFSQAALVDDDLSTLPPA